MADAFAKASGSFGSTRRVAVASWRVAIHHVESFAVGLYHHAMELARVCASACNVVSGAECHAQASSFQLRSPGNAVRRNDRSGTSHKLGREVLDHASWPAH